MTYKQSYRFSLRKNDKYHRKIVIEELFFPKEHVIDVFANVKLVINNFYRIPFFIIGIMLYIDRDLSNIYHAFYHDIQTILSISSNRKKRKHFIEEVLSMNFFPKEHVIDVFCPCTGKKLLTTTIFMGNNCYRSVFS